jgi:serine/threonine protein kinase
MNSLEPGNKIDRYEIRTKLGAGSMGEVYLATDLKLERSVALKVLPARLSNNKERIKRFLREAKSAASLSHPNIAHIYESGESEGVRFIAMEFVKGNTLRDQMSTNALTISEALGIACQIASALCAAHEIGIVHRDLKPENVMCTEGGVVKVLDFGLAKIIEKTALKVDREAITKSPALTQPGMLLGTTSYMSPEQVRAIPVDPRSDIFSLGCVTYEMLARHPPFEGATPSDLIAAILEKEPTSLVQFATRLFSQLDFVVMKALRKNRDERYQSAKEFLVDLRILLREVELDTQRVKQAIAITVEKSHDDSISSSSSDSPKGPHPQHIRPILEALLEDIQEREGRAGLVTGLSTGFAEFDSITRGLNPQNLITLVATPSIGASSLCVNLARNVASINGVSVLFFSLQRSKEDVTTRLLCSQAHVDLSRFRSGFMSRLEWESIAKALGRLVELRILIDDSSNLSLTAIKKKLLEVSEKEKVSLIIVDYVQLLSDLWKESEPRLTQYAKVARYLRALAVEFQLTVLVVLRTNASFKLENLSDYSPRELPNLPQYEIFEELSDLVAILTEESKDEHWKYILFTILKNRNGTNGWGTLAFLKEAALFENVQYKEDESVSPEET